jgi:hypothetical protein
MKNLNKSLKKYKKRNSRGGQLALPGSGTFNFAGSNVGSWVNGLGVPVFLVGVRELMKRSKRNKQKGGRPNQNVQILKIGRSHAEGENREALRKTALQNLIIEMDRIPVNIDTLREEIAKGKNILQDRARTQNANDLHTKVQEAEQLVERTEAEQAREVKAGDECYSTQEENVDGTFKSVWKQGCGEDMDCYDLTKRVVVDSCSKATKCACGTTYEDAIKGMIKGMSDDERERYLSQLSPEARAAAGLEDANGATANTTAAAATSAAGDGAGTGGAGKKNKKNARKIKSKKQKKGGKKSKTFKKGGFRK